MLTDKDEYQHNPSNDLCWQESVVLIWYDPTTELGGIHRIGVEPNQNKCNTQNYIARGKELLYKYDNMYLPLSNADWDNYQAGVITRKAIEPLKSFQFLIDDPYYNCQAELTFKGFHPAHDYSRGLDPAGQIAANHFEGAGLVSGWVKKGSTQYNLKQGVGMRDHSWGVRYWNVINNWRWVCGIFGDQFAFNALTVVTDSGMMHGGFVFDGQETLAVKDCCINVILEDNGKEHKGTNVWFKDEKDRTVTVSSETLFVRPIYFYEVRANEGLSKFIMDQRTGHGIVEFGYRL